MDGMRVELVSFDSLGIIQRCFQRVLYAIDLVANPLSLKDVFRRIGGKSLEPRVEALQQRFSDAITNDGIDRE